MDMGQDSKTAWVQEQLERMTLIEKATLVNGATFFGTAQIDRLSIDRLQCLDGGTGMNFEQLFGDLYSREEQDTDSTNGMVGSTVLTHVIDYFYEPECLTPEERPVYEWIRKCLLERTGEAYAPGCFPSGMLLGATFQPAVVRAVGEALGAEAKLFGVDVLLGSPNVNIHRDPCNGRLFEGYSEDPCLVSKLAPELVKGVQQYGVAANVKHFAANNQETNRVGINETISERALREIYYPGFAACVQEGRVKTVMSAYNRINGVPCTESEALLTKLLRDEWGFAGLVMSDWGAVYHPVAALAAGNDLAMPGPSSAQPIVDAVQSGELSEETLNRAAGRMLELIEFCKADTKRPDNLSELYESTTRAAYEAAAEGIVLLKNENGLFPLSAQEECALYLVGSGSQKLLECGTGSAGIHTDRTSSLANGLAAGRTGSVEVLQEHGYTTDFERLFSDGAGGHVVFVASLVGMEGNDRTDLRLCPEDEALLARLCEVKARAGVTLTLVLNVCGPVDVTAYEPSLDALFVCFLPGMEGAHALADLMLGARNPSGRLPLTFPKHYEDTPTFLNFPGDGYEVNYGEGIYVGYRYYEKKRISPAYAFGFGLSYTTFAVDAVCVRGDVQKDAAAAEKSAVPHFHDCLRVSFTVRNTGGRAGSEVVQIYISDCVSTLPKPVKELKAFTKIFLQPGEERRVTLELTQRQFASYDMDVQDWIAEEGYYDIVVAASADPQDIWDAKRVYLENQTPYSYGLESTVKVFYEHPQLRAALAEFWEKQGWDWQIVQSNYQYTPNRTLREILPQPVHKEHPAFAAFLELVYNVEKE